MYENPNKYGLFLTFQFSLAFQMTNVYMFTTLNDWLSLTIL